MNNFPMSVKQYVKYRAVNILQQNTYISYCYPIFYKE